MRFFRCGACYTTVVCMKNFSISATVRTYPKLPYLKIKETVLGKTYSLSLVFIGEKRAEMLNKKHRGKTYIPNVLSFPLTNTNGEIYITPSCAPHEAAKYDLSPTGYVGYLFIHGLLHLKGHGHGDTMSRAEKRLLSKYNIT
jgi:rRNA maturation RNase YbeY